MGLTEDLLILSSQTLPVLYGPLRDVVDQLTFSEMIDILQQLTGLQPDLVKQSLAMLFGNKVCWPGCLEARRSVPLLGLGYQVVHATLPLPLPSAFFPLG